ncbi:MAG TPA: hypothetical protein VIJ14_09855 [Rhabdochlamydiaceae bacterium]
MKLSKFWDGPLPFLVAILLVILVILTPSPGPRIGYQVGDCFASKSGNIQKVTEVGKYGLKAITPSYNSFTENFFTLKDLQEAIRIDCFDYFEVKDPNK